MNFIQSIWTLAEIHVGESTHLCTYNTGLQATHNTVYILTSNHEWYGDNCLAIRWRMLAQAEGFDDFRIIRRATEEDVSEARSEMGSNLGGDGEFMLKHHLHQGIFPGLFQAFLLVGQ